MYLFEYLTRKKRFGKQTNNKSLAKHRLSPEEKAFLGFSHGINLQALLIEHRLSLHNADISDHEFMILRESWSYTTPKGIAKFLRKQTPLDKSEEKFLSRFAAFQEHRKAVQELSSDVSIELPTRTRVNFTHEESSLYQSSKLYLMVNSLGLLKIGISINPLKRASTLTNTSGVRVTILAIWEVSIRTRDVELYLHKYYAKLRTHGEWFASRSILIEDITTVLNKWREDDKPTLEFRNIWINELVAAEYYKTDTVT